LALRFFLFVDDLLKLFLAFGLLALFHGVLDLNFKLCSFVVNGLIKGEIGKPSGQYLGLICDESLTCRGLNSNPGHFSCFTFIFVSCVESSPLVSWCAGSRYSMVGSDEDRGWNRRPSAEGRGWSHRSGIRWPDDREVG
jgi:hypothetical protein